MGNRRSKLLSAVSMAIGSDISCRDKMGFFFFVREDQAEREQERARWVQQDDSTVRDGEMSEHPDRSFVSSSKPTSAGVSSELRRPHHLRADRQKETLSLPTVCAGKQNKKRKSPSDVF